LLVAENDNLRMTLTDSNHLLVTLGHESIKATFNFKHSKFGKKFIFAGKSKPVECSIQHEGCNQARQYAYRLCIAGGRLAIN
jgi:hypothetical protein